jgi:hypothetical protein
MSTEPTRLTAAQEQRGRILDGFSLLSQLSFYKNEENAGKSQFHTFWEIS